MIVPCFFLLFIAKQKIAHRLAHGAAVIAVILLQLFRNSREGANHLFAQIPLQLLAGIGVLIGKQYAGPPVNELLMIHIVDTVWQAGPIDAIVHKEIQRLQSAASVFLPAAILGC